MYFQVLTFVLLVKELKYGASLYFRFNFKMSSSPMEPPCKQMKIELPQAGLMDLPNEILKMIFLLLKTKTIHLTVASVCKRFLELTRLPDFCENFQIEMKCQLTEGHESYGIRNSCLERIKKLLKVFPDCNLQLHYYGEDQVGSKEFFGAVEDLVPFQYSITDLTLSFHGQVDWKFSSKMICLEKLKHLHIDLSNYDWELGLDITDLPSAFWNNFPNLTSLKIENCSDGEYMVSVKDTG